MNYASPRYLALVSLTSLLACSTYCFGKSVPIPGKDQAIRTVGCREKGITDWIYQVLINVMAEDQETQAPVQNLNPSDFEIFDNGALVKPVSFWTGSSDTSRPIAIWLLVSCPEKGQGQGGVSFAAGNTHAFKQALASLESASTVGVARWCANGEASTDLLPTQDRDAPLAALEKVLHQAPVEPSKSSSTRAFQRALELTMEETNEALPVIVAFYDGTIDIPRDEADLMAKKLLYHGAILYQVKNRDGNPKDSQMEEERLPLYAVSHQTGGRVYLVQHEDYLRATSSITSALRSRYILGWMPRDVDRQWHEIRVRLTEAALQKHKSVRLDYGTEYLALRSVEVGPPYSKLNYRRAIDTSLDTSLAHLLDNPTLSRDILFDVSGYGFIGSDRRVELNLRLTTNQLTWDAMPNGNCRSEINIVVASYSEEGKNIGHELIQFEIVRDEAHLQITGNGPFSTSETVLLPENTSRIRVAIRDVATGNVGSRDISLKEVLSAPGSPKSWFGSSPGQAFPLRCKSWLTG